jgi:AraC-like DNA-binding protein
VLRLTRHSRFATKDEEEYREAFRRLLDRKVELMVMDDSFHFAMHTATLELLNVSTIEVSEGLSTRLTNVGYSLVRVDLGRMDRRANDLDQVFTSGTGYLATPERKAEASIPYTSGIGTVATVTITLPDSLIRSQAEALIGEPVTQPLEIIGPLDLGRHTHLGQAMDCLLHELDRDDSLFEKYPLESQRRQRELATILIAHTHNNYTPLLARRHGGPARRHVALMEELIEANIKCPPGIADLALAVGVSARTLLENCHHVRGMCPEDMARKMRLHAVHKRLGNPQPGDTVTDVAHEYSFFNIQHLAKLYMEEFHGERPWETLQRARRRLIIALGAQFERPE